MIKNGCKLVTACVFWMTAASVSWAQVSPPPQSPTLWSFLGIPQACQSVKGALLNRKGKLPCLEPKPPLKAIADVANLESDVPIIKKMAEIKQAEDLKPQKIKAIRYLGEIGCGCYDTDGSVTEAIIAATEDCTEDVRLAMVETIAEAADGQCCAQCGQVCCCNEEIAKQLAKIAYERDDAGCYVEPSRRVREAAGRALALCCPDTGPVIEVWDESQQPQPTPPEQPYREGAGVTGEDGNDDESNDGAAPSLDEAAAVKVPRSAAIQSRVRWLRDATSGSRAPHAEGPHPTHAVPGAAKRPVAVPSFVPEGGGVAPFAQPLTPAPNRSTQSRQPARHPAAISPESTDTNSVESMPPAKTAAQPATVISIWQGTVAQFDPRRQAAHVHCPGQRIPFGTIVSAYTQSDSSGSGVVFAGEFEVYKTFDGSINIKSLSDTPTGLQPGVLLYLNPRKKVARRAAPPRNATAVSSGVQQRETAQADRVPVQTVSERRPMSRLIQQLKAQQ